MHDPTRPFPATTIALLRPDPSGFLVFMVQRNRAVGFLPNAWVFPGGRVEPTDRLRHHAAVVGGLRAAERLGGDLDEAIGVLVAGVRETFEEAAVWLGQGMPRERRFELGRDGRPFTDVLADTGASLELDRLYPWSRWVTPSVEPKRFDTRFLVAVTEDTEALHDSGETVASRWLRPRDAYDAAQRGDLPMAPPTWWTLHELAQHDTIDEVLAASASRALRPIEPIAKLDSGEFELLLPGDPEHPEPAIPDLPSRVVFTQGRWWARPKSS